MLMQIPRTCWLLALSWLLVTPVAAKVLIHGARVIYDENRGEATVHLEYLDSTPALLQIWMDRGDAESRPGQDEVPFIITPSVTRLEPGNGQSVRILRVGDELAQDRETLFYFNTLEIPPKPTEQIAAEDPYIQFAMRGRLKFFYRPRGLPMKSNQAPAHLQFSLAEPLPDGRLQVRVHNPTPYHVTLSWLVVRQDGDMMGKDATTPPLLGFNYNSHYDRMVAPMDELLMPLEWVEASPDTTLPADLVVDCSIINDQGGQSSRQYRIE